MRSVSVRCRGVRCKPCTRMTPRGRLFLRGCRSAFAGLWAGAYRGRLPTVADPSLSVPPLLRIGDTSSRPALRSASARSCLRESPAALATLGEIGQGHGFAITPVVPPRYARGFGFRWGALVEMKLQPHTPGNCAPLSLRSPPAPPPPFPPHAAGSFSGAVAPPLQVCGLGLIGDGSLRSPTPRCRCRLCFMLAAPIFRIGDTSSRPALRSASARSCLRESPAALATLGEIGRGHGFATTPVVPPRYARGVGFRWGALVVEGFVAHVLACVGRGVWVRPARAAPSVASLLTHKGAAFLLVLLVGASRAWSRGWRTVPPLGGAPAPRLGSAQRGPASPLAPRPASLPLVGQSGSGQSPPVRACAQFFIFHPLGLSNLTRPRMETSNARRVGRPTLPLSTVLVGMRQRKDSTTFPRG